MSVSVAPPREGLIRATRTPMEVRAAGAGEPARLSGHFCVFNTWTEISSAFEGNFLERVAPGAARKTLRENRDNIKLVLEHGQDPTVGLKPLGRYDDLREDGDVGVFYDAELYDAAYVNELLPALRDGAYGASFRFRVVREDWVEDPGASDYNPKGLPERTIKEMSIAEGGPVLWGAYPTASAVARSLTDEFAFRRLMDLTPSRLREMADFWEERHAAEQTADVADETTEQRDVEDVGHLAQALACLTDYVSEADEPADMAAVQEIAQRLADLISAEVAEPEDDTDETNSSAPEETPRAARSTPITPTPAKRATSVRANPYTLTRKEPSWKIP
jgi:HK97 family phage prohead protease